MNMGDPDDLQIKCHNCGHLNECRCGHEQCVERCYMCKGLLEEAGERYEAVEAIIRTTRRG